MLENSVLAVNHLTLEVEHKRIIEDLSFNLQANETICILGPNGAGKSMLLKTLLGMYPHSGEVVWKKGVKIGYVPQRLPFIKDMPLSVKDLFSLKNASLTEIKSILYAVGFDETYISRSMGDLSSGQFQRMLIAWSLVGRPQVLLFDEPTTGIDVGGEDTIYQLLAELKKSWNFAMLLITHDLNVVYQYSDRVICFNKTHLCTGKPRDVLTPESLQLLYGTHIKYYQHQHREKNV